MEVLGWNFGPHSSDRHKLLLLHQLTEVSKTLPDGWEPGQKVSLVRNFVVQMSSLYDRKQYSMLTSTYQAFAHTHIHTEPRFRSEWPRGSYLRLFALKQTLMHLHASPPLLMPVVSSLFLETSSILQPIKFRSILLAPEELLFPLPSAASSYLGVEESRRAVHGG